MLWLKFKDENDEERRVAMDGDAFTVGRHSACDLTYTDSRLSREHLRLEREGDGFLASDLGSSNGTTLNGQRLNSPTELKDGDTLDLGGGLQITVEIEADQPLSPEMPDSAEASGEGSSSDVEPISAAAQPPASYAPASPSAPASDGGGIPTSFFIIAPLLGIFVLAIVVGGIFLFGGSGTSPGNGDVVYEPDKNDDNDEPTANDKDDDPPPVKSATPPPSATPSASGTTVPTSSPDATDVPINEPGDNAKVERNGTAFIRQIALNDPRAFLTGEQTAKVQAKVKAMGRSTALAENINSARKNAAAIKSLAAEKNLKPEFLAIAGIVKLGGSRGDVLQAVQNVAEVYDKLSVHLAGKNFDDALLLIAAYDQGVAGDTMKLRNTIEQIAKEPNSPGPREIRSVWYLQKVGKISSGEFDRVLQFLAIGTIAQNPKEFGVNAEALKL